MILLPEDVWEIHETSTKGRGIFAKKDIAPGTLIGDYIGKVIKTSEEDTIEEDGQLYLLYYHDNASIFPDIPSTGVHLINHSCMPNSWMKTYMGHSIFFTLRHIFAGEELTISYLVGPEKDFCNPPCTHHCTCGSLFCTGTFHMSQKHYDAWNEFELKEIEKTKRKRIRYGKILPVLPEYPKSIPDHSVFPMFGNIQKPAEVIEGNVLPSVAELRERIRSTGKTLLFPSDNKHIYGIADDTIMTDDTLHHHFL